MRTTSSEIVYLKNGEYEGFWGDEFVTVFVPHNPPVDFRVGTKLIGYGKDVKITILDGLAKVEVV